VTAGAYRIVGFEDFSLFVDEIADTFSVASLGIVAGAISNAERTSGVTQEEKRKAKLLRKGSVLRYCIETHSEYFDVLRAKVGNLVAEPATLGGSTRGVGFGIKP